MVKSRFEKNNMRFWAKSYSKILWFYYRILLKITYYFFQNEISPRKKGFFDLRFFYVKTHIWSTRIRGFRSGVAPERNGRFYNSVTLPQDSISITLFIFSFLKIESWWHQNKQSTNMTCRNAFQFTKRRALICNIPSSCGPCWFSLSSMLPRILRRSSTVSPFALR